MKPLALVVIALSSSVFSYSWAFLFPAHKRYIQKHDFKLFSVGFQTKQHQCEYCNETFESRNSLFRHLRNSECSSETSLFQIDKDAYDLKRVDTAILLSYEAILNTNDDYSLIDCRKKVQDAEFIGDLIREKWESLLTSKYSKISQAHGLLPSVISSTQTSVAKQRHFSLSQENGVSSAGEVMMLSYSYPVKNSFKYENKSFQEEKEERDFKFLLDALNDDLSSTSHARTNKSFNSEIKDIQIKAGVVLRREKKLHAEMDCTQRVYHYVLPLSWLKGGNEVASWWLDNQKHLLKVSSDVSETKALSRGEPRAKIPPPNDTLIKLKSALRSFESAKELNWDNDLAAIGRYGAMALKQRTAFHNFADPNLKGDASPSNKPVWRVVDRCRILQFIPSDEDGCTEVSLVIEIRADDILIEQVRRIIGSSIAITNGWLSSNFTSIATDPNFFTETPLGPPNRHYFADARFHFDELTRGSRLFEENILNLSILNMQKKIIHRANEAIVRSYEEAFLSDLKTSICPRINFLMLKADAMSCCQQGDQINYVEPPEIYDETLRMLRDIVHSGKWLATSTARSKIIKKSVESEDFISSGSFTIINPMFQNGYLLNHKKIRLPLGNQVFPDLVMTIFQLEENISKKLGLDRTASSHCAVNRNAQFTPHVDSGRGSGQSRSMIVGLGEYTAGELLVEGASFDIRYKPLEFDGWKQRHWTASFQGERFSLVWFTPEL